MVFLPQMTTSLPSTSADFRRVIWTGLYSQVVLMNVPVGGDIGDEVCFTHELQPQVIDTVNQTGSCGRSDIDVHRGRRARNCGW